MNTALIHQIVDQQEEIALLRKKVKQLESDNLALKKDVERYRCLADMAQVTAWLNFTTAQANHDLQRYGEWRCDYASQASVFQQDYENARRKFDGVSQLHEAPKPAT